MESQRQQKVSRMIQKELGDLFLRSGKNLVPGSLISVTVVRISPDLSVARIYLSIFPVKDKAAALKAVQENGWELRKNLGARIRNQVRVIPELVFFLDDSYDYADNIDRLLKK